ncbi:pollen-specific protein SF21-like, partial [Helianthus annuus]|uniref:pollen-specific protein SF21-like n=1 Tax=Helianthus annuus TaxID=4232 RepID=UPI0016531CA7
HCYGGDLSLSFIFRDIKEIRRIWIDVNRFRVEKLNSRFSLISYSLVHRFSHLSKSLCYVFLSVEQNSPELVAADKYIKAWFSDVYGSNGGCLYSYTIFAFSIKYSKRVSGLILVSPICRAASWNERFYNKLMSKLLQYCGMCDMLKELLIHRYFSKAVCGSLKVPESEIVRACRKIEKLKLVIKEFFKEKDEEKERLNGINVGFFVVNEKDKGG